MVVQLQDGSCYCLKHIGAGVTTESVPDDAKSERSPRGFLLKSGDPERATYKVSVGGYKAGIYTGKNQAMKIMKEFNQAMDDGEKSFTFPPDKPEKKGIFKP